ncbi:MAG TPA: MASE1 domain-containing protein [Verrucomicrobiae bacterium]
MWLKVTVFSLAFYLSAEIGRALSVREFSYVNFWLPAGLLVGTLLLNETRSWPWFLLAALPANLAFDLPHGTSLGVTLGFYAANSIEALAGAWLVRRFVANRPTLASLKEFFGLLLWSGLLSTALGALMGALTLVLAGMNPSFWSAWKTWWASEAAAIMLVAPAVLIWFSNPRGFSLFKYRRRQLLEAALLVTTMVVFSWYLLVLDSGINSPYKSRLLPLMLWAGLRFGRRGATAMNLLFALLTAAFTCCFQKGLTPGELASGNYIPTLQTFLEMSAIVSLVPAIMMNQRDKNLRQLQASEERFRRLTEASFEGIFIVENGRITDVNDQGLKMLGYQRPEVVGFYLAQFISPETSAEAPQPEGDEVGDQKFIRKDGTRFPVAVRGRTVQEGETVVRMVAVQDITEQKRAEEQQRKLEEQLREAHKMEALGTLAGGTAHEFNNMLGVIIGFSELAKSELERAHPAQASLDEILGASNRAKEIVQQVLTFSRQQNQKREPLPLASIVTEALKSVRKTLPATVQVQMEVAVADPIVLGNSTQIHQVIANICINAWHAMVNNTGAIEIFHESITLDQEAARIHPNLHAGKYARISIADNGQGMAPATLARVFEPFFTTKGPGKGSGLGLAVVHGIMEAHDGAVIAKSELGRGTTFQLYFPLRPDLKPKPAPVPAEKAFRSPGRGEHILIVDDEPALVRLTSLFLKRFGYQITGIPSPLEALETIRRDPAQFDLVISDLTMPGMKGTELAELVGGVRPDLPFILISGFNLTDSSNNERWSNIRSHLQKPIQPNALASAVQTVLATAKCGN